MRRIFGHVTPRILAPAKPSYSTVWGVALWEKGLLAVLLSSELGKYKTARARFWPWLSIESA